MADLDYYKVLGVSKGAKADEIRKAYRKLARENHPDAKPDDKSAAERFKQIQEAYDVLNDDTKRKQYDQFGSAFQQAGRAGAGPNPFAGGGGFGGFGGAGPIDLGDLFGQGVEFSEFFGGAAPGGSKGRGKRPAARGEDVR
ncbi:MAG: J domain-containing protein, partial [Candidatus Saccharimonas sp.]|nr:J domain-containing protein [Planctomycetaceae bacterium]